MTAAAEQTARDLAGEREACPPDDLAYRPAGLARWLGMPPNFVAFLESEKQLVRLAGRTHYSARTIGEYLRHETCTREAGEFKINNNNLPLLARLYMRSRRCPGFFATRQQA